MFFANIKYAWRHLLLNKGTSFLNIVGLAAGLAGFVFIALWVADELSYDKFNRHYDRIVRLVGTAKTESGAVQSAVSSAPMAKALKDDYGEVENTVRMDLRGELVLHNEQQFQQPDILLTDPSFFDIFSYSLSKGNPAKALSEPFSVVLTESTAKKYFGEADPLGQVLTIFMLDSTGRGVPYTVTGLMPDPPQNAHFRFTMLVSFKTVEAVNPDVLTVDGWGDASYYTYLLLKKGVDAPAFSKKIAQFYGKHVGELANLWRSIYTYSLQPLKDIHLRSQLQYEMAPTVSINHIYIFSAVGIFILLLAAINYVNLSTAASVKRAKEAGVRKVVGAARGQLIGQYLSESLLTALLAFLLSLLLCFLLQPYFFLITGKNASLLLSPSLLLFLLGTTALLGLLSGLYPAFVLAGYKPIRILKGAFQNSAKGIALRRSLVAVQFTVTLVLVIGIAVIYSQMRYMKHKDLGYDKEALLYANVNGNTDVIDGFVSFKNDLLASPYITKVATSNSLPVTGMGSGSSETIDRSGRPVQINTARLRVDADYLNAYGIKLLAGGNFKSTPVTDSVQPVILNEAAVRRLGWESAEAVIGKPFRMGNQAGSVIGVVGNFHFSTLQEAIQPLCLYPRGKRFSRITLRIDTRHAGNAVALLEQTWKKHFPSALLEYGFLDEQLAVQYATEERFSNIFFAFSVLSLLIACLGLYGLVALATAQKTKEIGIRKVLGATVGSLVFVLSKDFLKMVLLAFLVAAPVAWYLTASWLQNYAYRVAVPWWLFVAAGLLVLAVALLTVGTKATKAALANPVKSLRTE